MTDGELVEQLRELCSDVADDASYRIQNLQSIIAGMESRAHAAESQLAAMGEALRNAACTCPLPYRAIKPEEHEESCLSLKVLSRLPERAKAWMGLREAIEREEPTQAEMDNVAATLGQAQNDPIARDSAYIMTKMLKRVFRDQALAALRALETGK